MLMQGTIEPTLDAWVKGMAPVGPGPSSSDVGAQGWNLLRGDLTLPCAVLKQSALAANAEAMKSFLAQTGAELWPHGKTTMSPELMARQIEDGASGITAANVQQMEVMLLHGHRRILIANQVVGRAEIARLAAALARYADLELIVLVDSVEGVALLDQRLSAPPARPLDVLVEMGRVGARTGVRSVQQGLEVARAVDRSVKLRLRGVETYEGIVPGKDQLSIEAGITDLFENTVRLAEVIATDGLFGQTQIILSGGGSQYYDMAALALKRATLGQETRILIRSGCYLTHDDGWLAGFYRRMRQRNPQLSVGRPAPQPAIEVWAHVQSRPEPERAFATMGKRDVSHDIDLPAPLRWFRPGLHTVPQSLPPGHKVVGLNDQHAYIDLPPDSPLQVGDLMSFGVSHPCTTFDKWRVIPIVDDDYTVISAVSTWF
jgi:D-serine dehydratase